MEFQLCYFKSWKMILWKCCTQYASKTGKLSSDHRTRKGQFSFQFQRKAIPKNVWTTAQLHSSHDSKILLKLLQAQFQQFMNQELPDVQAGFRKGRGTRYQIANIHWIIEKARVPKKHLLLLYWLCQTLDCVDHNKLWKILRDGNTRPPDLPPETSVWRSRSNSWNWTWNIGLVPNWERSTSRLCTVTLLI